MADRGRLSPHPAAEVYEVGASNLGHVILYSVLNQQEGLLCDRAYYPADDMQARAAAARLPGCSCGGGRGGGGGGGCLGGSGGGARLRPVPQLGPSALLPQVSASSSGAWPPTGRLACLSPPASPHPHARRRCWRSTAGGCLAWSRAAR